MTKYKKIDADTVETTETVVGKVKISSISEQIKMTEREIATLTARLSELKTKERALRGAK